ncbi:MAG: sulfotransferase family 2 domain-containing protein [Gammaproteobacteria bacterium]|nr:sulfotransferase family 2 domain-containing protein [Gammaproteobacteria bacterium]
MIVSHKHQFIFLKTSKTAGTSIEIALSRFCDNDDIVTKVSDQDEKIRHELGGQRSSFYPASKVIYNPRDWYRYLVNGRQKQKFYNHIPARKLKLRLPDQVWNNYFRFCVVRNPWDRVLSQYHWRYRLVSEDERPSLDEFLESRHVRSLVRKGYNLYTINGEVQVHKICRYENLIQDLEQVRQELQLPSKIELPGAKSGFRKDRRHYREVLNDSQGRRITELFQEEVSLMDYSF